MSKLNQFPKLLLAFALVIGAAALLPGAIAAAEAAERADEAPSVTDDPAPALQAGRVVHIDPATGRKNPAPSASERAAARAHMQSMVNRSTAGLIETASPTSGVMVNLQGRFRHATGLTVGATGEAASECTAALPPLAEVELKEAGHE